MGGATAPFPAPGRGRSPPDSVVSLPPASETPKGRAQSMPPSFAEPSLRFGDLAGVARKQPPVQLMLGKEDVEQLQDAPSSATQRSPNPHGSLERGEQEQPASPPRKEVDLSQALGHKLEPLPLPAPAPPCPEKTAIHGQSLRSRSPRARDQDSTTWTSAHPP